MSILTSINSEALFVDIGTESYAENDVFSGTITVHRSMLNMLAVLAAILCWWKANLLAEIFTLAIDIWTYSIDVLGFIPGIGSILKKLPVNDFFGITIGKAIGDADGVIEPLNRWIATACLVIGLRAMSGIGIGQYEILGEPFDYVHSTNSTIAIDDRAPLWMESQVTEENDLIFDEAHAQQVAVRELIHRVAENNSWDSQIIDDPRIEPGDIIELPDTSRIFVQDYERDLTRGSPALLTVRGFRS
jgi:hypothetical protein